MKLKVFTTHRQIRKWLEGKDNEFLDKHYTLGEFLQKIIVVDGKKFIDGDLRKKYLFEAIKSVDIEKLGISRDFLDFFNDSEFIFSFFNELFLERVELEKVKLNDVYLDYEYHLEILGEILKNYEKLLEKDGYVDRFLIKDFRINRGLLEGIEKIEIRLDGYLSKFDIEVLEKIDLPVEISFEVDKFNKSLIEKSLGLSLKEKKYVYELKSKSLTEFDTEDKNPLIEIGYVSDRINQINFVFSKIAEFVKSGIEAKNIAVILPDEEFSEFLKLFDEKRNLNFAMGESFSKSDIFIKLKAIFEYLSGDEEAFKKCEDVYTDFEELDLIEFIKKHASNKELKVIDEELFKLEKFRDYFDNKKDFLYFVLERLKDKSFDDVYSGLVTCMGVLESRGMEFDGVIILDFNDDIVPNVSDSDLFLNTFIRKHSNLPTKEERENLQKHYYYQLIKNAKKVAVSYVKNEEKSPSRFLYELKPDFEEKEAVNLDEKYSEVVLKTSEDKKLTTYDEEFEIIYPIYPTNLKMLIECPKRYYFSKILEIENEEIEDEFFGNVFHEAVEEVVKKKNDINSADEYYKMLIEKIASKIEDKKLLFEVLVSWDEKIKKFCELDFEEMKYSATLPERFIKFEFEGKMLAARVDRIDVREKEIVLIDYKTSKSAKKHEEYPFEFQTTFYYLWAKKNFPQKEVKIIIWDINEVKKIEGVLKIDELKEALKNLPTRVKEAEDIVYKIDKKEKTKSKEEICRYCEYRVACGREL